MPLAVGSRPDNVMKSHDAFVQANVETGLNQTVYYMHQPIPAALQQPTRWIVSTLVDVGQVGQVTLASSTSYYAEIELLSVFNIYEKADIGLADTNRYTLAKLAADVAGVFSMGLSIPVYDYDAAGPPQDGGLSVKGFPVVTGNSSLETRGIRQMNVTVRLGLNAVTID